MDVKGLTVSVSSRTGGLALLGARLFRDYLRADPAAAGAYGQLKRALAAAAPDDWHTYYAVKDPACDVVIAAAEHWAVQVGWKVSESDA